MNRLAVSISILSVMTVGCIASVVATNSITDRMTDMVDIVEEAYENGDKERCIEAAEELSDIWDGMMKYSILINDLGHAVEITSSIAEVVSFAEEQDDELYASCDRAQAQIEMFREIQLPTLWKIL